MRIFALLVALLIAFGVAIPLQAGDADRGFSGKWLLDQAASRIGPLGKVEESLNISQSEVGILCSAGPLRWSYALDGSETRKRVGEETWSAKVKWEGAALLTNTLVSGAQNYSVMDRWELSRDRNTLTITRDIIRAAGEARGTLVYRREGAPQPAQAETAPAAPRAAQREPARPLTLHPDADAPPGSLATRPAPGLPPDVTVPAGTHVLLALVGEISTKHAKEGDRVYLRTDAPVAVDGRVVIPRGSDVAGTITRAKPAGKVKGKGELYLRFDSLILPNGVSRDFHARPSGEEGKVQGDGKAADGRTVIMGTGVGASVGSIGGLSGVGIGSAAGALAGILLSRNKDFVLRPGTHVDMVLDRDLVFHPDEIPRIR